MAEHWNGGSGGKGSKPRPFSVSQEEYDNSFERIFGKKIKKEHKNESDSMEQESMSILRSGQEPAQDEGN